jgi:hypothetical protein
MPLSENNPLAKAHKKPTTNKSSIMSVNIDAILKEMKTDVAKMTALMTVIQDLKRENEAHQSTIKTLRLKLDAKDEELKLAQSKDNTTDENAIVDTDMDESQNVTIDTDGKVTFGTESGNSAARDVDSDGNAPSIIRSQKRKIAAAEANLLTSPGKGMSREMSDLDLSEAPPSPPATGDDDSQSPSSFDMMATPAKKAKVTKTTKNAVVKTESPSKADRKLPATPKASRTASTKPKTPQVNWTDSDNTKLVTAKEMGMSWLEIQAKYFPEKTAQACRRRFERLQEMEKKVHQGA